MNFVTYLQLFASYWCSALLTLFPGRLTYRQFALIMAFVSAAAILVQVFRAKGKISMPTAKVFVGFLIIILLYSATPYLYHTEQTQAYHGFWLSLVGQSFPAALLSTFIATDEVAIFKLKKNAIIVAGIFTALSIVAVFNPTLTTTGGFVDNESGLNYQSASYLAGYATGLFSFILITREWEGHFEIIRKNIGIIAILVGIALNFITILISGGRGGLACFLVFITIAVVMRLVSQRASYNTAIRTMALIVVLVVGGYFAIRYAASSTIATSGYSRILTLFTNRDNNGRTAIATQALQYFKSSPIIGHGLGSVFYEMGYYAHNIFLDILIEAGIMGLIIFVALLLGTTKEMLSFAKLDRSDCIIWFIFLCDFTESLFSGYYLSLVTVVWAICFTYARARTLAAKQEEQQSL